MNKHIAASVLERDQGRCQYPTVIGKCGDPRVELHHRRIRSQLGKDTEENLIALCQSHHMRVHAKPNESRYLGLLIFEGDSPSRLDWMNVRIPED